MSQNPEDDEHFFFSIIPKYIYFSLLSFFLARVTLDSREAASTATRPRDAGASVTWLLVLGRPRGSGAAAGEPRPPPARLLAAYGNDGSSGMDSPSRSESPSEQSLVLRRPLAASLRGRARGRRRHRVQLHPLRPWGEKKDVALGRPRGRRRRGRRERYGSL